MKRKPLPIGISDFRKLIRGRYHYVDKSFFVREVIEASAEVLLLPRPRRFGKTLNMDMLKVFFETGGEEDPAEFFVGLSIEKEECFDAHRGKYPVISLTFKDLKHPNWEQCFQNLKTIIYREYQRHRYLLESDALYPEERRRFEDVLQGAAGITDYENGLQFLCEYLSRHHKGPVIVLIDEYDTPLHAGYAKGYYEEIIGFMRNFLSAGLKDNPHLFRGVLTGILRVAKESIFSGLNNLGVYTILNEKYSRSFGFTGPEVEALLEAYGMADRFETVSGWYDGYRFGKSVIYNPWSVLNYIDAGGKFKPYWVNTGDTAIIERLATRGGKEIREEIGSLLEGESIERPVYETIVMRDLDLRADLLWSFLLFSGYLKSVGESSYRNRHFLAIPNREVKIAYEELIIRWFSEKVESNCLMEMLHALSSGDVELFERLLRKVVMQVMSYHDLAGEPEKVYHAFVLGMLVWMEDRYVIRSNRESGYGRYDILMKPKDPCGWGIVIEFKLVEKKGENAHEAVLEGALEQIEARGYVAELGAAGVGDVLAIAVAFRGKELWVRYRK